MSAAPYSCPGEIAAPEFARLKRRTVLEHCKWDPQYEDVSVLAPFPLVLPEAEWTRLCALAERLDAEALRAEAELVARPELHVRLGLPRGVRRALRLAAGRGASLAVARTARYDFHFTTEGWRISEANSDVPGGQVESGGFTRLVAERFAGLRGGGDPARATADAIARRLAPGSAVGLVHATSYADDRMVMELLGRELRALGLVPHAVAPDHLRWSGGRARLATKWTNEEVGALVRFFPGEWLEQLPRECDPERWFAGSSTPLSNPATALLWQSKRFPLVWDALSGKLPTWRELLPETRDPRDAAWRRGDEWVVKPALGRVGEAVGIPGVTTKDEWRSIRRSLWWHPGEWVAQRRFQVVPLETPAGALHPCVGVYVIDGSACGAYGRLATRALVDARSREAAVLVRRSEGIA